MMVIDAGIGRITKTSDRESNLQKDNKQTQK